MRGFFKPNPARLKYGNKRQSCTRGHSHASKLESSVCAILSARESAGELTLDKTQDHVYLTEARIGYIPDFRCIDTATGATFWVEAKGFETERWAIIKKLWAHYGPGKLEIWKGSASNPRLVETLGR